MNILNELNEKCNSASALPGSQADHYDSNQMCLVKAINKQWHRGRVLKAQGGIFDILLVDTAAVVKITNTSNMRLISHSLAFSPPHGAELCCLYNTEAKGDVRAVRQAMIEMVEKPHTLVVVEVIGERKMVDVIIDEKYSMRDALISLHMVRTELTINLSNKVRSDNLEALNTKIALVYKNTNKVVPENHLPAGLLKRVKISHKVSPFEIYVLDEDDVDMQEMGFELNRLYSGAPRDHCFLIREGLYCVCLKDDIYHRVKVLQGCGDNSKSIDTFFYKFPKLKTY